MGMCTGGTDLKCHLIRELMMSDTDFTSYPREVFLVFLMFFYTGQFNLLVALGVAQNQLKTKLKAKY